ncbi:MAG: hypothetical protein WC878_00630 [Candidatus Paceibacterota bacterium]|jgi:hypothetical protein
MEEFIKNTNARLSSRRRTLQRKGANTELSAWQRKTVGILLLFVGFISLVTPLTPGSWLVFVGAELLGVRLLFLDKIKARFMKKKGE